MIYLTLFYILFTLFFAIYGIAAVSKNKAPDRLYETKMEAFSSS